MKTAFTIIGLFIGLNSFAADGVTVDCSNAKDGKVSIVSTKDRLSMSAAAELGYGCLIKDKVGNAKVRHAKAVAIKAARDEGGPGSKRQCGQADALKTLSLRSWSSGRPYVGAVGVGEMSSEETMLVREQFTCSAIGTGLYEGIVSSVNLSVDITESFRFSTDDESFTEQKISIVLKEVLQGL